MSKARQRIRRQRRGGTQSLADLFAPPTIEGKRPTLTGSYKEPVLKGSPVGLLKIVR
jgi:hypothetical protein